MANQQVIVSVLGDTKNFSRNMKSGGKMLAAFGAAVVGAALVAGRALADFVGDSLKAAEESLAVQRRFEQMAIQSKLFGTETKKVTDRIAEYARAQSFATGVDDEAILSAASRVLAFRKVAKSAGEVNGVFDRTIAISQDVAAALAGTGDSFGKLETIAPRVAKALDNPAKNLSSLARIGVQFTDQEKNKIIALQETEGLLAAQNFLLEQLEIRYGGTALAGAKATEQIQMMFEDIQEQIGTELLPAVKVIAEEFGAWLEGPGGKKAIGELVSRFREFGNWIGSPEGRAAIQDLVTDFGSLAKSLGQVVAVGTRVIKALRAISEWGKQNEWLKNFIIGGGSKLDPNDVFNGDIPSGSRSLTPGMSKGASVVVNFNSPVDSVSAGREVAKVLADYNRARGI